jgi:hypothetical protein
MIGKMFSVLTDIEPVLLILLFMLYLINLSSKNSTSLFSSVILSYLQTNNVFLSVKIVAFCH